MYSYNSRTGAQAVTRSRSMVVVFVRCAKRTNATKYLSAKNAGTGRELGGRRGAEVGVDFVAGVVFIDYLQVR